MHMEGARKQDKLTYNSDGHPLFIALEALGQLGQILSSYEQAS